MISTAYHLTRRTALTLLALAKIMVPIMIAVRVGEMFGLSEALGVWLEPVMQLVGLPGETGIVWAVGLLTGLYGAVGALLGMGGQLDLSVAQISILATMILFAHGIPIEQAIVKKVGASFWLTSALRVGCAVFYGLLTHWLCSALNLFQQPVDLGLLALPQVEQGWPIWFLSVGKTFVGLFVILFVLLIAIDAMKRSGIFDWLVKAVSPLCRRLGIEPRLAPITVIGMLLGLSYGSGLLIDELRGETFEASQLLPPLAFLSINHGLIEDTTVMALLGSTLWIVLVGRFVFGCIIVWGLSQFMTPDRPVAGPA